MFIPTVTVFAPRASEYALAFAKRRNKGEGSKEAALASSLLSSSLRARHSCKGFVDFRTSLRCGSRASSLERAAAIAAATRSLEAMSSLQADESSRR